MQFQVLQKEGVNKIDVSYKHNKNEYPNLKKRVRLIHTSKADKLYNKETVADDVRKLYA